MRRLILAFIMFFSLPSFAFDKEEQAVINIYKRITPAIVCIDSQLKDGISCGTGCVIDKSGIILTSAHVLDRGKNIIVTTYNGQNFEAKVIKYFGEKKDIALLKVNSQQCFKTVKLGDSAKIKVGQKVWAIGNPFGFNGTLTQGIISRIVYVKSKSRRKKK